MRSVVSVSVMMMPLGETVNVTFRNFLALALACGYETKKTTTHLLQNQTEENTATGRDPGINIRWSYCGLNNKNL